MAFSAIEALQAFGLGAQMQQQRRTLDRQERDYDRREQTRMGVSERVGSGDYEGATQTAIAGGEYDLAGSLRQLSEGQRAQALQEAQIMGRAAAQLKAVPMEQRPSAYQQIMPLLKQAGFSDEELAQADLSDKGLDGYVSFGQSITSVLSPPKPEEEYTLNPGGIRMRGSREVARSPYDPVVVVDGQLYPRPASRSSAAPKAENMTPEQLQAAAQEAVANGADPAAVNARLQEMLGGAGGQRPQTFP